MSITDNKSILVARVKRCDSWPEYSGVARGGGGAAVLLPWAAKSKGRKIGQQNEHFK
jgi:hypothetical protein